MRRKKSKPHIIDSEDKSIFPGYPLYPSSEDIFNKSTEMQEIDPENINDAKQANEKSETANEKSFEEDRSGDDLDIPGVEQDDEMEAIGSEDEENNFYSLSGYDQVDLAEEKHDENQIEN
jgi:hypothetical protein